MCEASMKKMKLKKPMFFLPFPETNNFSLYFLTPKKTSSNQRRKIKKNLFFFLLNFFAFFVVVVWECFESIMGKVKVKVKNKASRYKVAMIGECYFFVCEIKKNFTNTPKRKAAKASNTNRTLARARSIMSKDKKWCDEVWKIS